MWVKSESYPRMALIILFVVAFFNILLSSVLASAEQMYYSMGEKYMEKGNFDMAVLSFKKAVESAPDWPEAHNALGMAYFQLLRFEDAVVEFNKAVELRQDYTEAKINRNRTMRSIERYKPVKGSRLKLWHKYAIVSGIVTGATVIYLLVAN